MLQMLAAPVQFHRPVHKHFNFDTLSLRHDTYLEGIMPKHCAVFVHLIVTGFVVSALL
jgi:hypothetical protein